MEKAGGGALPGDTGTKKEPAATTAAPPDGRPFEYRALYKWGGYIIGLAPIVYAVSVVVQLLQLLLLQVEMKVIEGVVGLLSDTPATGVAAVIIPESKMAGATLILVVGVAAIAASLLCKLAVGVADNRMGRRLQQALHDKLLTLGPNYHTTHDVGNTTQTVTQFSSTAQQMLVEVYSTPIVQGAAFVSAVLLLFDSLSKLDQLPMLLSVGLLATLIVFPLVGIRLASTLRSAFVQVRDSRIAMMNELMNSLSAPLEVQVMDAAPQRQRAFSVRLKEYFRNQLTAAFKNDLVNEFQGSVVAVLRVMFIFAAAYSATVDPENSTAAVVPIVGFITLIPLAVAPLRQLVAFVTGMHTSWPYIESAIDLLEQEPETPERAGATPLVPKAGEVELRDVTFRYAPGGLPILDGLSHTFEAGSISAIVAASGGGKSTVLNQVARLWDPQGGQVLVDGQDVAALTLSSLRQHVVKVSQFPLFIAASIRENCRLAKADATDAQIEDACRKVGLWEALTDAAGQGNNACDYMLPRNPEDALSGGQLRRLAMARALLRSPSVLLLDEPTTGLDALARQRLATLVKERFTGLTVLLVDHDMEFVAAVCDEICCLESGRFTLVGSPAELEKQPCLFKELWDASRAEDKESESAD